MNLIIFESHALQDFKDQNGFVTPSYGRYSRKDQLRVSSVQVFDNLLVYSHTGC